ncbi:MAG: hypothetical protein CMC08_03960 [Flavobacteriaceae bacterium]|nr:hypothetical protein [Flavobacteriaceae bacterium]
MKTLLHFKIAALALFGFTAALAQTSRTESFSVTNDVLVQVNTTHTNVIFETWNKDKVEVEAYIDGEKLSEAEKRDAFRNWKLDVLGNSRKVVVTSTAHGRHAGGDRLSGMPPLPDMEFMGPLMEGIVLPLVGNLEVPPLPDDLMENLGDLQFDYEAYEANEEAYMKKWEKQIEKRFGKDFEHKMEKWGEAFGKQWEEKHGSEMEKRMEAWGEQFGEQMEQWGESFGKRMETWGKEIERQYGGEDGNYSKKVTTDANGNRSVVIQGTKTGKIPEAKGTKTIIVRMPKGAKTEINVRHGEIKMADAMNVRATLNYSPLTANSIGGGETLINAAYAPVVVKNWNRGTLYVKYVDDCNLASVNTINLQANSSNVLIGKITDNGTLSGSFGNLRILNVGDSFNGLDILLENTDAMIELPSTAFSFYFNGKKSTLSYPKSLQLTHTKNDGRVFVKGFNQKKSADKLFTINATYSNVKLQ